MSKAYHIVNWDEHYEVNDHNSAWRKEQKKRSGSLDYIRLPAHGRKWPQGFRDFLEVSGKNAAPSFGVFVMLLELAGEHPPEYRGWILGRDRTPLDAKGIAKATGFASHYVTKALETLTSPMVRWVELVECPFLEGSLREIPEIPDDCASVLTCIDSVSVSEEKTPDAVLAAYREHCVPAGLPDVRELTDGRKAKLRARLAEPLFRENFVEVFRKAAVVPFLCGENKRGWKATFDFLIRSQETYMKVLEDGYGGGKKAEPLTTEQMMAMQVRWRALPEPEQEKYRQDGHSEQTAMFAWWLAEGKGEKP